MRKLSLIALLLLAQTVWAASTWNGGGADTAWTTPENWGTDPVPGAADDAIIGTGGTAATLSGWTYLNSLLFNATSDFGIGFASPDGAFWVRGLGVNSMTINSPNTLTMTNPSQCSLNVGNLTVTQGKLVGPGPFSISGTTIIESGATLTNQGGMSLGKTTIVRGTLGDMDVHPAYHEFLASVPFGGTLTLEQDGVYRSASYGAANACFGNIVISNTAKNVNDRWAANALYTNFRGSITLLGNDSVDTHETIGGASTGTDLIINIQHGANANAVLAGGITGNTGLITITGNDINGTGTYSSKPMFGSYGQLNGNYWGDTGVIPNVFIDHEFTTCGWDNGQQLFKYAGTGRQNNINGKGDYMWVDWSAGYTEMHRPVPGNILIDQAGLALSSTSATLTADNDILTLKIANTTGGAPITVDLGGFNLNVGKSEYTQPGAGILRTGTQLATITNGTLCAVNGNSPMFINADEGDLLISATVKAGWLVKGGTGKLTVNGAFVNTSNIYWYNGDLELNTPTDVAISDCTTPIGFTLTKNGNNTLTLGPSNATYNQATVIVNSGTLAVRNQNAFGPLLIVNEGAVVDAANSGNDIGSGRSAMAHFTLNGGTLKLPNDIDYVSLAATNVFEVPAGKVGTVVMGPSGSAFYGKAMGTLQGSGTLVLTGGGRFTFNGNSTASTFTGDIHLQQGSLMLSYDIADLPGNPKTVKIDSGAALGTWGGKNFTNRTFTGNGSIIAVDEDGAHQNRSTITNSTIAPTGTFTVGYGLTFSGSSNLNIGVGASTADQIAVAGSILGLENTTLTLAVADGAKPSGTFTIVNSPLGTYTYSWGQVVTFGTDFSTMSFANVANDGAGLGAYNDGKWKAAVHFLSGSITVDQFAAIKAAIPGDANHSGLVDQDDYKIWYDNYGTGTTWEQGNFKGSGVTDQDDYKTWYDNYGVGTAGGAVPEPATMALLALGGLAMLRRRK